MVSVSHLQAIYTVVLKLLRWCIFLDILRLTLYLHFIKSCDIIEPGFAFIHKNGIFAMRVYLNILNHLYIHWNMVPVIPNYGSLL